VPDRTLGDVAAASVPYCLLIVAFAFLLYFFWEMLPARLGRACVAVRRTFLFVRGYWPVLTPSGLI
jgi:hypothetical protein